MTGGASVTQPEIESQPLRGAYGFSLIGVESSRDGLLDADPAWPRLRVVRARREEGGAVEPPGCMRIDADRAEFSVLDGDRVEVERATLTATLRTREPLSAAAVLHPYLALAAAVAGHWLGRRALHGGAFAHAEGAWALLGGKGAGKSSTLAALLRRGVPILSDDVVALDGATMFAGPRTIDLRDDAAALLGGTELGLIGARTRWRLRPGAVPPSAPLAGFVELGWGEEIALVPLAAEERVAAIVANSFFRPGRGDELALLELAVLPAWRLVRPRRLDALEPALDQLLAGLR